MGSTPLLFTSRGVDPPVSYLSLEISKIVENNLKKSGLFNPLDKEAFLQKPDIAHLKPRFEDWALIKAQALITGKVNYLYCTKTNYLE